MTTTRLIASTALLLLLPGVAGADPVGEPPPPPREDRGRPGGEDYFVKMLRGLDTDGDRAISFAEFAAGERVSRLPEEAQRRLFGRLDKDGDGQIRRDEIPRTRDPGPGRPFDPNRDGKVTYEEFRKNPRFAKVPEERVRALFDRMDRDGDGILGPRDWKGPGGGKRPHGPPGLATLDRDGDGAVSFAEFAAGPRMKDRPEEARREAFNKLDRDGNGSLEGGELHGHGPRPGGREPGGKRPDGKRSGGGPGAGGPGPG